MKNAALIFACLSEQSIPLVTAKLCNQVLSILWFRILGIFSVENIKRLCVFMFQSCYYSQLLRRVLLVSAELTIGATLKHKNTQHLYIFNRIRVLHLNRLKGTRYLCKTKLSFLAVLKSYHFMLN